VQPVIMPHRVRLIRPQPPTELRERHRVLREWNPADLAAVLLRVNHPGPIADPARTGRIGRVIDEVVLGVEVLELVDARRQLGGVMLGQEQALRVDLFEILAVVASNEVAITAVQRLISRHVRQRPGIEPEQRLHRVDALRTRAAVKLQLLHVRPQDRQLHPLLVGAIDEVRRDVTRDPDQVLTVLIAVIEVRRGQLPHVRGTHRDAGLFPRAAQGRQQHTDQQRDDRHDNQQLNQREPGLALGLVQRGRHVGHSHWHHRGAISAGRTCDCGTGSLDRSYRRLVAPAQFDELSMLVEPHAARNANRTTRGTRSNADQDGGAVRRHQPGRDAAPSVIVASSHMLAT
jgi:hypothetical protein